MINLKKILGFMIVSAIILVTVKTYSDSIQNKEKLSLVIENYDIDNRTIESALFELADNRRIPIGIEEKDFEYYDINSFNRKKYSLNYKNIKVSDLFTNIASKYSDYYLDVNDKYVINVRPVETKLNKTDNVLDKIVDEYNYQNCVNVMEDDVFVLAALKLIEDLGDASAEIYIPMVAQNGFSDPDRIDCVNIHETNIRVIDILNTIVNNNYGGSWAITRRGKGGKRELLIGSY